MHKHVPKIQGEKYNKDDSLNSRLTLESDLNFFDNIEKNEKRSTQTSPLKFLSLYAIKTNIVIYELKYLILSITSGIYPPDSSATVPTWNLQIKWL